jgi:phosphoserine aminotransferase
MRPWNFSAGPSALPLEVLEQAAAEMTDWHGCGMSVMEMSHRGKQFTEIHATAEADLRELLNIPSNFRVLFMQGGATAENAIVPMNLLGRNGSGKADYVLTGTWSNKSFKEAQRYGDIAVAASSEAPIQQNGETYGSWAWFPPAQSWKVRPDAAYVHVCTNETIGGLEYTDWQAMNALQPADVPLVLDMSSHFLSCPVDF